jgi:hypothetical protein
MTVPIDSWRQGFAGDGISILFPLSQLIYLARSDLTVVLCNVDFTDVVRWDLGNQYTLEGNGATGDGALRVLTDPPAVGQLLVVIRDTDARQQASFNEGDGFPAKLAEGALDREAVLAMEHGGIKEQSLRAPVRELTGMNPLPVAPLRANKILGFDVSGQPMLYDPATLGGGGGDLNYNNQVDLIEYTVTKDDELCYREFDTSAGNAIIIFDPTDASIPDGMQVFFAKSDPANILYVTTDGVTDTAAHAEHSTNGFSVRKVGNRLKVFGA